MTRNLWILGALGVLLGVSALSVASDTGSMVEAAKKSAYTIQAPAPMGLDFNVLFDIRLAVKHQTPLIPSVMKEIGTLTHKGKQTEWHSYALAGWDVAQDHGTIGLAAAFERLTKFDQISWRAGLFVRATPSSIPVSGGFMLGLTWKM